MILNINKTVLFDDLSPDESIGAFGASGQWIELCTVDELRNFEAMFRMGKSEFTNREKNAPNKTGDGDEGTVEYVA